MKIIVESSMSWSQIVDAVRDCTINNPRFNISDYCLHDAEILQQAANLIMRELTKEAADEEHN